MFYKAQKETYPGIGKIPYEGKDSKNPLSFRWYNPEEEISGKKMKTTKKFSIPTATKFTFARTDHLLKL